MPSTVLPGAHTTGWEGVRLGLLCLFKTQNIVTVGGMSQTQEEGGGVSLGVAKAGFWEDKYLLAGRDRFVHLFSPERPPYLVLPASLACQTVPSTGALQFSKGTPGLGSQALGHPRRTRISRSCLISVLPMATKTNVLGSLSCPVLLMAGSPHILCQGVSSCPC